MTDDATLAAAARAALAKAGPAPPPPGSAAAPAQHRRLPGFLGFAGAVLGAAAAVYQRADGLGLALTATVFGVLFFLMGLRLTRRMHPNQAAHWRADARRRALAAAAAALQASGRLSPADRLAAETLEDPTLDLRLLAQAGAAPPTAAGYLEEALAGRSNGIDYALGAVDHGASAAPDGGADLRGLLIQIDLGRPIEDAALMTWESGALADAAHDWFARTHRAARAATPPVGVERVRVQGAGVARPFERLPRGFFDALGRHLAAQDRPPFLLAATDRRLLLYIQQGGAAAGALTGPEDALRDALAQAQMDPSALEGPALVAAAAILPLHRLVATLGAASAPPEA